MSKKAIHHVLHIECDHLARELVTTGVIKDPFNGQQLRLERLIWDTGATSSVINESVSKELGLIPTDQSMIQTANGSAFVNVYWLNLTLTNGVNFHGLKVSEGKLGSSGDMLIGMGDFLVQNREGLTEFCFCFPPLDQKFDMVKRADSANMKIRKRNRRHRSR